MVVNLFHPIVNDEIGIGLQTEAWAKVCLLELVWLLRIKRKKKHTVYVLIGDGECYEGAIWELLFQLRSQN